MLTIAQQAIQTQLIMKYPAQFASELAIQILKMRL
jgi:hypothetical protein